MRLNRQLRMTLPAACLLALGLNGTANAQDRAQAGPTELQVVTCFITKLCVEFEGERPVPIRVFADRDYGLVEQPLLWDAYRILVADFGYLPFRTKDCRPSRMGSGTYRKPTVTTVWCVAADGSTPSNPPAPAARVPFWVNAFFHVEGDKVIGVELWGSKSWRDGLDRFLAARGATLP